MGGLPGEAALRDARPACFWLDRPDAPEPAAPLREDTTASLAVVGAGFTGLWTALLARERDPSADVVLLEGRTAGWAASGRNGGFCSASLTHGLANGLERFGPEMPLLDRLGRQNLDEIEATVARHGIDCDFERTGELSVATRALAPARPVGSCRRGAPRSPPPRARLARPPSCWTRRRCGPRSPRLPTTAGCGTATAARWWTRPGWPGGCAGHAWRRVSGSTSRPRSARSTRRARACAWTPRTGACARRAPPWAPARTPPLLRRLRRYLVPVYDYAMMTEPLSAAQRASIGWQHRQGVGDMGNQFHYYRLTGDGRILWGGYDAVYYNGGLITAGQDQRPATFAGWPGSFSRPSRSSKGSASRTPGAA